jgi:uncharacterized protein
LNAAEPGQALRLAPRRFSRGRLLAFQTLERAAALLGGRRWYRRRHLAPGRFRVRRERVEVQDLPEGLEGWTIVQLSDPHAGPFLAAGDLAHVVRAVNALQPDLVVLTGDLLTRRAEEAYELLPDLARIEARLGRVGVFGNHDYRGRREAELAARFGAEAGFQFLRDESVRFEVAHGALALVGLEDLEEARRPDAVRARSGVRPGDVEVVLCHNPLGAPRLARPGCAAILCGHTHGHQIDLPLVRRLAPRHPGDRFRVGPSEVIVNRGLGALGVPLRVASPAEIVVVEFTRAGEGPA